ncbi:30S ribosomal protein S6 [Austwickia chelonae NBRC 105200]|uniref:Small ribosomal subunit protein bS6 n=2 Tax=Austwickia TaxID=1184606 RepID=K6V9Z9_9MICO|nr:30S ribosomal protein S6 [Austwickia chelonae NBRC 105200]
MFRMRQYEMMIIVDPEIDDRQVPAMLEKFLTVVKNDKGTIENVDVWGRRRMAFDIKKKSEGVYVVVNFTSEPATAQEMDRQLGLSEMILRTKLLRPGA